MEARQHKDRAIAVARERGIARSVDFDKAGVPRVYLQRLMREGALQRIGRGLYKLSDAPSGAASSLAEAWRIQPKG
ncbi:MAG TPA: type IV toxin-antitoxin system AbiEi family antitoxin domain-containing protein [Phenylobacterium sp.]|uniref:type IV toxin-antitoxin system AbiEi family antitoxin domain-containing protein n=1 Tax=Phenylobacterium sp. TaxID=1871053 RepID=UPI002B4A6FAC|nr:type IV toxin-antitoxin system AbiEi family antitoxin domain-containing protein [Phenylobacterium sp.]HKR87981.1 type IV toxin-antitoxin system AbiEi family antitoxin domain-containing protein [Phenylobacterium sp.]HKT52969.1 type IV toxin-antitoxin system AbiEi family antitoxin domain-containing protein [Caulobacteraceae bacterium]